MRRRYLAFLPTLPLADALSLGNFQQITAILLPGSCSAAYNGQIPSCTVSDFQTSCSLACQSGLGQVASNVQSSCQNVIVNPNALLGIVMNGGIIQALCPSVENASSTVAKTSAAASVVTLPTASPGVTGGEGTVTKATTTAAPSQTHVTIPTTQSTSARTTTSKTVASTSAQSTTAETSAPPTSVASTPVTSAESTSVTSTESTPVTSAESTSVTSVESTSTSVTQGGGGTTSTLSDTSSTSRKGSLATSSESAAASATSNAKPQSDSGGGSPFDISSSASRIGGATVGALVTIAWLGVLFGR